MNKFVIAAVCAAAGICIGTAAIAEVGEASANASVTIGNRLIQVNNLNGLVFGSFMPESGEGTGTITVAPNGTGTSSGTGQADLQTQAAKFTASGEPGATVTVGLPSADVELGGQAGLIVNSFTLGDGEGNPIQPATVLDGSGQLPFSVGGTLTVSGTPAPGTYSSSFSVTVNY